MEIPNPPELCICKLKIKVSGEGVAACLFFFLLIFIEFIGTTLFNKIIKVSVYYSIIHHLYIVLCVHHPRSSLLPSPPIPPLPASPSLHPSFPLAIIILLSVSMKYFLTQPPNPLPSDSCQSGLYLWVYFFC